MNESSKLRDAARKEAWKQNIRGRKYVVSHHKNKRRQDHRGEKPEDSEIVDASHISYTPPQPVQLE